MITRRAVVAMLAVAAAATHASRAGAADPVFLPGSRVGLVPPSGMVKSETFRGFEDRPRQAVIIVSELAAETFDKVAEEFTLDALRSQGFVDITREEVA